MGKVNVTVTHGDQVLQSGELPLREVMRRLNDVGPTRQSPYTARELLIRGENYTYTDQLSDLRVVHVTIKPILGQDYRFVGVPPNWDGSPEQWSGSVIN